jgi:triphosphatase
LHQARVALRRLRSALSIFKPIVADDRFAHLANELKWLAGSLGAARDVDVLRQRVGDASHPALLAAHEDAYTTALAALDSKRTRDLMIDVVEWTALGTWRTQPLDPESAQAPAVAFASEVLRKLRRRINRRGRDLDHLDDEARHQVRITAKKLRYATGFFQSLYPDKRSRRRFKAFTKHLEALQDHLGILNDLATAPALLDRFGLDHETALPVAEREPILSDATDAYERLMGSKRFW